jgi:preprotein translocase subunit SecB
VFFLNHINFEALYQQRLLQQRQAGAPAVSGGA